MVIVDRIGPPSFLTDDDIIARSNHIVELASACNDEGHMQHLYDCHVAYEEQMRMMCRGVIARVWVH